MDNKKMESEKFIKSQILSTTTPTTIKTDITPINLSTTTDNDSSTDSSDLISSWTFVNDELQDKLRNEALRTEILESSDSDDYEDNDVEEERAEKEEEKKEEGNFADESIKEEDEKRKNSSFDDDQSDGISIISENESLGEGLELKNHRIKSNIHQIYGLRSDADHTDNEGRLASPYCYHHTSRYEPEPEFYDPTLETTTTVSLLKLSFSVTKHVISCALYVGIGLVLLGFTGNMLNTNWLPYSTVVKTVPSTDELNQMFSEMELQNNLMRAEIDILSKQVKHLTNINDPQQKNSVKNDKFFKVWPGNGDSMKPVDITKKDLKKPYKCPDGSFVEIGNMCLEQQTSINDPPLVDQFGQVVENLKDLSEAFTTFEQVAEELHGFEDNPTEEPNLYAAHKHHQNEYKHNNDWKKSKTGRQGSAEKHYDTDSDDWRYKRSKGREQLRNKHKSDEDDDDDSDDWHDNYMKHRQQQRKKNEYKSASREESDNYMKRKQSDQKNQYKKNGHSRENKRGSGEKLYR